MKSVKLQIISIVTFITVLLLYSCENKKKEISDILTISTENVNLDDVKIEKSSLNIGLKTPKWIYLKTPITEKIKMEIFPNLIEHIDPNFEKKLCLSSPNFYHSAKGFWFFDETEFTRLKQKAIIKEIEKTKHKEFGGYYNSESKKFVSCSEKWNGRTVIYLTDSFIYIMIFQTSGN